MRKSLANRRARYYEFIWKYKQRREALRIKYPAERLYPFKRGDSYNKAVAQINKKIKLWNRQIKKIDMISNKIMALGNAVAYFTGHNVKDSGRVDGTEMKVARMLFYKYGIENLEIEQKLLREYVGAKRVQQPAEYRKAFNTILRTDRTQWENFKAYFETLPVCTDDFIDRRKSPGA